MGARWCLVLVLNNFFAFSIHADNDPPIWDYLWNKHGDYEYYASTLQEDMPLKTWYEASAVCRQYGARLSSITDANIQNFLMELLIDNPSKPGLGTGLNKLDRQSYKWSDGQSLGYDNWGINQPSTSHQGLCAHFDENNSGKWYNENCAAKLGFFCKRRPDSTDPLPDPTLPAPVPGYCPTEYTLIGEKCLKLVSIPNVGEGKTWNEAVQTCRSGPGYMPDLASISTPEENAWIVSQLYNVHYGLWIGFYRRWLSGDWYWTDNTPVTLLNWATNEPSSGEDHCVEIWVELGTPGTWNNAGCSNLRGYVCETWKDEGNVIPTMAPTPSSACQAGYTSWGNSCYKLVKEYYPWYLAQSTCADEGANLVSIHSEAENANVLLYILEAGDKTWIGYNTLKDDETWGWSDEWPKTYEKWAWQEPSDVIDGGCAVMDIDGLWYNQKCNDSLAFLCKTTTASPATTPNYEGYCLDGWVTYGHFCYLFVKRDDRPATWEEARKNCLSEDSDLVYITNENENSFIFNEFEALYVTDQAWIGLYWDSTAGDFKWTDGTVLGTYRPWAPAEPDGTGGDTRCVEFYITPLQGQWNDELCDNTQSYVCKKPRELFQTVE